MGFSLSVFFRDLISILYDNSLSYDERLDRLCDSIDNARDYAKECGSISGFSARGCDLLHIMKRLQKYTIRGIPLVTRDLIYGFANELQDIMSSLPQDLRKKDTGDDY